MTTNYAAAARAWLDSIRFDLLAEWDLCIKESFQSAISTVDPTSPTAVYNVVDQHITALATDPARTCITYPDYTQDILRIFIGNQQRAEDAFYEAGGENDPAGSITAPIKSSVLALIDHEASTAASRLRDSLPKLQARFEGLAAAEAD